MLGLFLSAVLSVVLLNSGPSRRCNTTEFPTKISLPVQLEAKEAQYAQIERTKKITSNYLIAQNSYLLILLFKAIV